MRINKQGFTLGSKYSYSFKFDSYNNSLTIKAKETEDYYPLFEDQGVTNITGVIGIIGAVRQHY